MIDIHCHILPGIDDGSQTLDESLIMARQAVADGIKIIAATPHTLNGIYTITAEEAAEQVKSLQEILVIENIDLTLCAGSEIHFCPGLKKIIDSGKVASFNNNKKYVLVEFPVKSVPEKAFKEFIQIKLAGITPVIAHPERNIAIQRRLEILFNLIKSGCISQISALSILGGFGKEAMECSHKILELKMAHVIASDAHNSKFRPPVLSHAVQEVSKILGNAGEAEAMVTIIPKAILDGSRVIIPEPLRPEKKRWFPW